MTSCHKTILLDLPECDYSVKLRYDYNEENGTMDNMLEYYIYSIDEFIFDQNSILVRYHRREVGDNSEFEYSKLQLPIGNYSVIAVGNRDELSKINQVEVGATRREDILLSLKSGEGMPIGTCGYCEKLYHGYETFTVLESGISHIRVDMVSAHFTLEFRITWKKDTTPQRGDYYATLGSIPSQYGLMPEWIYPTGSTVPAVYSPGEYDSYLTYNNNIVHHIPIVHQDRNLLVHRTNTKINGSGEMWGEFTTYRIKATTEPILRIFKPGTKGSDTQIVKDIALQRYFDWYDYMLDTELKQQYAIDIVIDGNKIIMMPMDVSDWGEGGII